jgi:hypothetical protein
VVDKKRIIGGKYGGPRRRRGTRGRWPKKGFTCLSNSHFVSFPVHEPATSRWLSHHSLRRLRPSRRNLLSFRSAFLNVFVTFIFRSDSDWRALRRSPAAAGFQQGPCVFRNLKCYHGSSVWPTVPVFQTILKYIHCNFYTLKKLLLIVFALGYYISTSIID